MILVIPAGLEPATYFRNPRRYPSSMGPLTRPTRHEKRDSTGSRLRVLTASDARGALTDSEVAGARGTGARSPRRRVLEASVGRRSAEARYRLHHIRKIRIDISYETGHDRTWRAAHRSADRIRRNQLRRRSARTRPRIPSGGEPAVGSGVGPASTRSDGRSIRSRQSPTRTRPWLLWLAKCYRHRRTGRVCVLPSRG